MIQRKHNDRILEVNRLARLRRLLPRFTAYRSFKCVTVKRGNGYADLASVEFFIVLRNKFQCRYISNFQVPSYDLLQTRYISNIVVFGVRIDQVVIGYSLLLHLS